MRHALSLTLMYTLRYTNTRAHSNFTRQTHTGLDGLKVQPESTQSEKRFLKLPLASTYRQDPWPSPGKNTSHSDVRDTRSWHKTGMMLALEIQLLLLSRENTNQPKRKK